MRLKWLGHASWKIKTENMTIYIDPYQGEYDEKADLVLSTHSHTDHCEPSKVNAVRGADTVVVAPKDCATKIGSPVKSLKPGEKASFGEVEVEAVEAYNVKRFRSPGVPFHPKGLGVGYLVRVEGKTVYHVGDSGFIPEMRDMEGVDLLLIPSGGTYTMDNEDAAEATVTIRPRKAIPMHIWDTDPGEFRKNVEAVSDVQVVILRPGDTYEL
ncbi:MAG: MBL fold metallo-hydrolase [Candidatus Bathyarchaeota archaeon]|nr:MAG: MBL fold metallo-hydrolase [Candidatus Bathyarchaeota archaeon]